MLWQRVMGELFTVWRSLSIQLNIVIEMEHQLGKNGEIGKTDTAT